MQQPLGAPKAKRSTGSPGGSGRLPGSFGRPGGGGVPGGSGDGGGTSRTLVLLCIGALLLAGVLAVGALLVPRVLDAFEDDDGPDAVPLTEVTAQPTATPPSAAADATGTGTGAQSSTDSMAATTATTPESQPQTSAQAQTPTTSAPAEATAPSASPVADGAVRGVDRSQPVPLGMAGSSSNGEWTLRLLQQLRGVEADALLLAANQFNAPAPDGLQYIVALVEVTYHGSGPDAANSVVHVDYTAFSATGERGVRWQWPGVVEPEPALDADLRGGESAVGWTVLRAGADETNLLLLFEPFLSSTDGDEIYMALDPDARVEPQRDDLATADTRGQTPEDAVPPGQHATTSTWQVWVEQVISGDEAQRILAAESSALDAPPAGMEYLLVDVGVRNISAASPSALIFPDMFSLRDGAGTDLQAPAVFAPDPELWYEVYTGGEARGWLALLRPINDPGARLVLLPRLGTSDTERFFLLAPAQASAD